MAVKKLSAYSLYQAILNRLLDVEARPIGGGTVTVDSAVTDGSNNPVSSNAVFDALASAVIAGGGIPSGYLDTSTSLAANSDTKVPTQKAVKTYVDANAGGGGSVETVVTNITQLNTAISTANSNAGVKYSLKANGGLPVSTDMTVPANVTLDFTNNSKITVAASKTLIINGDVIAPPGKQIFDVSASGSAVKLYDSPVHDIYPEWFGCVADGVINGSNYAYISGTDNYAKMQACLDSLFIGDYSTGTWKGKRVRLGRGIYCSSSKLVVKNAMLIRGLGGRNGVNSTSQIKFTSASDCGILLQHYLSSGLQNSEGSVLSDFSIIGTRPLDGGGVPIRTDVNNARSGLVARSRVSLSNFGSYGFQGRGIWYNGLTGVGNCNNSHAYFCESDNNNGDGYYAAGTDANAGLLAMCSARGNHGVGFNDQSFLGNKYDTCHAAGNEGGDYKSANYPNATFFDYCYSENIGDPAYPGNNLGDSTLMNHGILPSGQGNYFETASRGSGVIAKQGQIGLVMPKSADSDAQQILFYRSNDTAEGQTIQVSGIPPGGQVWDGNLHLPLLQAINVNPSNINMPVEQSFSVGAKTINKSAGLVYFDVGASSLVVTNSLVHTYSMILLAVRSNDGTAKSASYVATEGSFTIYLNAAATAQVSVGFVLLGKV